MGGAAAAGAFAAAAGFPMLFRRRKENILLIVLDAERGDKIGKAVNGAEVTPFQNRLAAEGVYCTQAFSATPWTKSSVASILAGQYPPYHGIEDFCYTLPNIPTLTSFLKGQGYFTFAVQTNPWLEGEINAGDVKKAKVGYGFNEPFDVYRYEGTSGTYASADKVKESFWRILKIQMPLLGAAQPFFAYLHFMDTHEPWLGEAPTEFTGRFHSPELTRKLGAAGVFEKDKEVIAKLRADKSSASDEDKAILQAVNDEAAAYLDSRLEEMLARLEKDGAYENTTVILTADHGDELLEHGCIGHCQNLYNTALAVPLILRRRGLPAAKVEKRVSNAMIFATVREWFGQGDPPNATLFSLMPYARDSRLDHCPVYANFNGDGKVILPDGREALRLRGGVTQFFELNGDPGEKRPLASDGAALAKLDGMESTMRRFAAEDKVARDGYPPSTHPWQDVRDAHGESRAPIKVTNTQGMSEERRRQLEALGYIGH